MALIALHSARPTRRPLNAVQLLMQVIALTSLIVAIMPLKSTVAFPACLWASVSQSKKSKWTIIKWILILGRNRSRNVVLPKIDNGRNHDAVLRPSLPIRKSKRPIAVTKSSFDPNSPLTLELKHGSQLHKVKLPTETLDKSKKYYVTFTINNANGTNSNGSHELQDVEEEEMFREEQHVMIPT